MFRFFRSPKAILFFSVFSALSLIMLVVFFYVPHIRYAIIPYVWIGWFLPIEGLVVLLAVGCFILGVSIYYLISKKARVKSLLSRLDEYYWLGMRIYLGVSWIIVTLYIWRKSTFPSYDFQDLVHLMVSDGPFPWYNSFLAGVVQPNTELVALLIQYAQFLIGFCFLIGLLTSFASALGVFLNVNFLFAISWADGTGTVVAQNLFYIFHELVFILLGVGEYFGVDKYLARYRRGSSSETPKNESRTG